MNAFSACWVISKPASSSSSDTFRPIVLSMILKIAMDTANANAAATAIPNACIPSCAGFPYSHPTGPFGITKGLAATPIAKAPNIPVIP